MTELLWLMLYKLLTVLAVVVVGYLVFRMATNRWARRAMARTLHAEGKRCICGYELVGLAVPRCPECGRAAGFDKSFEDMGISLDELRPRTPPPPPPQ